jgi:hypothetical protein
MYRQHKQQKLVRAILAVACLALAGWSGWRIAPVAAANPGKSLGTKTVNIYDQNRMHAVIITKVIVAGEQIQPGVSTGGVQEVRQGTPFQADDEWLKNTSITLQNRTDKMIVRAEIMLLFPDAGDGSASRPLIEYMITLGQRPEINSYNSRGEKFRAEPDKKALLFAPGQTLVVPLADYIDSIQSMIEYKLPLSQITRLVIRPFQFFFVDGMRWDENGFATPDTDRLGQYKNLGPKFFPGDQSRNWPPQ